jgi:hypothetical protein
VNIRNVSARLIHLNLGPAGIQTVPPLGSIDLDGEHATAAKVLLDGTLKPFVDDGSLVIDGKAKVNREDPATAPTAPGTFTGTAPVAPTGTAPAVTGDPSPGSDPQGVPGGKRK